jgi:hypothetical protein
MNDQAISIHHDPLHPEIVTSLVLDGDIARLSGPQRVMYYVHRCQSLGIDPGEQPFQLIKLNGKLVLYPKKECAQALTRIHHLSVEIRSKEIDEDNIMTVCARAIDRDGQFVDDEGVLDLSIEGPKIGLAQARMKCVTKAKRRAVLSKCGLGGTDAEDVPGARVFNMNMETGELDEQPTEQGTISVDMAPRDRVKHLVSVIVGATGRKTNVVYSDAVKGSGIDVTQYTGDWPRPDDLSDADAGKVAGWLELNKNAKPSAASNARPRPRPAPAPAPAPDDDSDIPF